VGEASAGETGSQRLRTAQVPAARRVLVPIDFTELAVRAIPWAYALAGRGGGVVLVHVVDPAKPPNPLYAHYQPGHTPSDEQRSSSRSEIVGRLRALAPPNASQVGITTEVEAVEHAKVAEGIRDAAERLRVDAICIASHCRGPIGRTILGSVTEALLRAADTPLFIVPDLRD
jgi:nucleotide-binding universal stress UspA family protein